MAQLKVMTVFGTRPEAIKMIPIVRQLAARPEQVQSIICTTAQHREMLDQVLDLFDVVPDYDLDVMRPNQTPAEVAARVLSSLQPLLTEVRPDWLLVQGDTTTVVAAALAAYYAKIKVGHVEAGLRTFDRGNPFPEEMNRVMADHLSDLCFAPTTTARNNLLKEGIPSSRIVVTGNTVIDTLLEVARRPIPRKVVDWFHVQGLGGFLQDGTPQERRLVLVTAHRRENHGEQIIQICHALRELARNRPELQFIYPVHRNPNIWQPVHALLCDVPGITLTPPVDYLTLVHLMKRSALILTDSGGIQEEAPSFGVPVLVLREATERPEAVSGGTARVVGTDTLRIIHEVQSALADAGLHQRMSDLVNPYGDGQAGERIVQTLLQAHSDEFLSSRLDSATSAQLLVTQVGQ